MEENSNKKEHQTIIINQQPSNSNTLGVIGFVLALISWLFSCLPFVGFLVWFLGALFSILGLFKKPRGLAIAGVIISFIGLIIIVLLVGGLIGSVALFEGIESLEP